MKKASILLLLLPLIMVGCKSKEEKAAELIKNELSTIRKTKRSA